ncbi:MAG: hypothetical protein Q8P68_00910 [Candidatus Peregrinibacteria bacterium]|nr:hypothetical protein [Candidatus Peregrinibacteria bacterium]
MPHFFFPQRPDAKPTIYAYRLKGVETHKGLLKIGYTVRSAQDRIAEQLKQIKTGVMQQLLTDKIRLNYHS